MRRRGWFKTAGVITFAAQLLGGAGLAVADNEKTCLPQPTFVAGGDPDYTSLTVDNTAKWTGTAGYGWNQGSGAEVSFEAGLAKNVDDNSANTEIRDQWLLLSVMSNEPMPVVDGVNGIRVGFDYHFSNGTLDEDVSQIILMNFDDGTGAWKTKPPTCTSTSTGFCANDPTTLAPSAWKSFQPPVVTLVKKEADQVSKGWPNSGTAWVQKHTYVWMFFDKNTGKYYWRLNMALPIRSTGHPGDTSNPNGNDPGATWSSPSIYLPPSTFATSGKTTPHFWIDLMTDATDLVGGKPQKALWHFPNWTTDPGRDSQNVPFKSGWGSAEAGSPRDVALLAPGELSCAGAGVQIKGTAGDNVVWHSAIWNSKQAPTGDVNTGGIFGPAGTLFIYDKTAKAAATNNMSVMVTNDGGSGKACTADANCTPGSGKCDIPPGQTSGRCAVVPSDVHATFLIAPYGSQATLDAISSVWSPLNKLGNDFTCSGGPGAATCSPQPTIGAPIESTPHDTTMTALSQGKDAQYDQASDWSPANSYICATRTDDTPMNYDWWWNQAGFKTTNGVCDPLKVPYLPNSQTDGSGSGLPGHQCIQAALSGNNVQFAIKSAFRNMHVAPASLVREDAAIDTRGLPKAASGYHDIYLYVETQNMPYRVDTGYAPTTYADTMSTYSAINKRCSISQCTGCVDANGACQQGTTNDACGLNGAQCAVCTQGQFCGDNGQCQYQIQARTTSPVATKSVLNKAALFPPDCRGFNPAVPVPSEEFITKLMPTFIVHAYADTGTTETINGKKVAILTPMTSFGQYVTHDSTAEGPVFGWDAGLEPSGNTPFRRVGVDTYRLRIPNDGIGHVVTRVQPLPTKRPTCSGTVNENIVLLLKAIAPLVTISSEDAGEINQLIDSLSIECVELQEILNKIDGENWGSWQSWVHYLITQIEATDGCQCN